jgi:hypothetical protein
LVFFFSIILTSSLVVLDHFNFLAQRSHRVFTNTAITQDG